MGVRVGVVSGVCGASTVNSSGPDCGNCWKCERGCDGSPSFESGRADRSTERPELKSGAAIVTARSAGACADEVAWSMVTVAWSRYTPSL